MKESYLMERFSNDNIIVQYWSINKVLGYSKKVFYSTVDNSDVVVDFSSKVELEKSLMSIESTDLICLELLFSWDTLWIYKFFSKRKLKTFALDYYINYPEPSKIQRVLKSVYHFRLYDIFTFGKLFLNNICLKLYFELLNLNKESIKFVPGENGYKYGKNVVSINHFDLYRHILTGKEKPFVKGKYAVFLDVDLVNHPDLKRHKRKTINGSIYFEKLNSFFDYIESNLGLEVVIAAHPKSKYDKQFGNRKCIYNETSNLVVNSSLVLAHHSMSLNFAVLSSKPICLLYTSEFVDKKKLTMFLSDVYDSMVRFKNLLNCNMINIESSTNSIISTEVDELRYQLFIKNYITSEGGDNNYKIVSKNLYGNAYGE